MRLLVLEMNDLYRWEYPRVAAALMEKFDTVILIVEDEPIVRNLVRAIIQHEGYSFLLAANGEEAIALSRAYRDIHDGHKNAKNGWV